MMCQYWAKKLMNPISVRRTVMSVLTTVDNCWFGLLCSVWFCSVWFWSILLVLPCTCAVLTKSHFVIIRSIFSFFLCSIHSEGILSGWLYNYRNGFMICLQPFSMIACIPTCIDVQYLITHNILFDLRQTVTSIMIVSYDRIFVWAG